MRKKHINVLLVDDNQGDQKIIKRILTKPAQAVDFSVETADSLSTAVELLGSKNLDVILLDLDLPDSSGIDTVQKICDADSKIPIIVLTGLDDEETAILAIKKGASDYLVKGESLEYQLVRSIRYSLERKQVENALAQKRNLLHTLVDTLPDQIFAKDTSGAFVFSNLSCAREIGARTPKDITGKTDFDLFPPEHAEKYYAEEQEIMRTGQPLMDNEVCIMDESGRIIKWVLSKKIPWRDYGGNIIGVVGLSSDITERKQVEEKQKQLLEEVEQANRELKEMQSQLVQNEKLASIGQLAAGVAHEINTPVGFVASNFQTLESYLAKFKGFLEMYDDLIGRLETLGKTELLDRATAIGKSREDMKIDFILEDIKELFDDSKEGLDRVTNVIQNLKDFSRIDQPGSLDEYSLNDGIEATLAVAKNEIKYDANVKTDLSEIPLVNCNSGQINQVFLNILVNAAQAIKSQERKGMGTITIKTYAADSEVICEISDDGPGIAPDKLPKIFDPFFTTKPAGKGTGLGLSVSHDIIVNKHNGRLLVESTVGKGAKFTVKLPVKKEETSNKVVSKV